MMWPFLPLQIQIPPTSFPLFHLIPITLPFLLILEQMPSFIALPGLYTCASSAWKALPPDLCVSLHSSFCLNTPLDPLSIPKSLLTIMLCLPLRPILILFIAPVSFICFLSSSSPSYENPGFFIGVNFTFSESKFTFSEILHSVKS